jgi:hypothetical protein
MDDADATYLLGFGRYSAASYVKRAAAVAAIVALCACLVVAVILALPGTPPEAPPVDHRSFAANQLPAPPAEAHTSTVPPIPKETEPGPIPPPRPKGMEEPKAPPMPPPKKAKEDGAGRVAPPRRDRAAIGKVEGVNSIVLTRADDAANWLRLDPADEASFASSDQVLCLPGFKADVNLESGLKVHLWGNVPELLPSRLLESRVRFHRPERKVEGKGEDFDADITLLAGRIYVTTTKAAGGKVRVRFANQVWDVALPDAKTEVMFEVSTSFDPGTPFAREGGPLPRVEAQAAVIRGTAAIAMHKRSQTFPKVASPSVLAWDSKTASVAEPKAIDAANGYYDRFLLVGSEQGKIVQKALSEMASRLKDRSGIRLMLAEILTEPPDPGRDIATRLAVYSQAAIVSGPTAADELKPLVDLLVDEMKPYARFATVSALAPWLAQSPGNTALLNKVLTEKLRNDQDPEIILRLLRGYVVPNKPDPKDLDRLVEYLNHSSVAVRELALWNLVSFVDPKAADPKSMLVIDVALAGTPMYEKFLKAWRAHIDEIKEKLAEKK